MISVNRFAPNYRFYAMPVKMTLILLMFAMLVPCQAQEQDLNLLPLVVNYTTKDGLPSNEVYAVLQDKKGFIWAATDRGLARYNNQSFEVFTTKDGLPDNVVFHIQMDQKGRIWFFPWNNKIFYYEYPNGFQSFEHNESILKCFSNRFPLEAMDTDADGNYYFYNIKEGHGMIKIAPNGDCESFPAPPLEQDTEIVYTKIPNQPHFLVDGTNIKTVQSNVVLRHKIGPIEVGTFENAYNYNRHTLYWPMLFHEPEASYFITGQYMSKISSKDTTSIILPQKIFATKVNEGYIVGYQNAPNNYNFDLYWQSSIAPDASKQLLLKSVFKTGAIVDNANGIWISSHNKGVFYIPNRFNLQNAQVGNINGIIPKKEELIFYNSDADYYNVRSNNPIRIESSDQQSLNKEDLLYMDVYPQSRKMYDVFYFLKDLENFPGSDVKKVNQVYNYRTHPNDSISLLYRSYMRKLVKSADEDLQLVQESVVNPEFSCFEEDADNRLWFGGINGVFKEGTKGIERPEFEFGTMKDRIQDIKFLNDKNLKIFATIGNGLYIIEGKTLIKHYTTNNGLSSDSVHQLYIDATQKLWIATNYGFHYIDLNTTSMELSEVLRNTSKLLSPNIKQIYVRDSLIYLGTDNGLNIIDWKGLQAEQSNAFPIYLSQLKINQEPLFYNFQTTMKLPYDRNHIEVSYTGLDYQNLGHTLYRYRISDTDDTWQETNATTIRLIDQKPGKYCLQLEAKKDSGPWVRAQQEFHFHISKPYWETYWFQGLIYLIFLLIVLSILWFYYRHKEKQRALNDALNSNMQKLFSAQLKPHFVFNSLSAIQNFILKNERMASTEYLGKFATLIRHIFENSHEALITLEKELETLGIYIHLEQLRFKDKFDIHIDIDSSLETANIYFPCNLLQPIVENAIQHGLLKKENKGLLYISIKKQENSLKIVIKDNGVGRTFSNAMTSVLDKSTSKGMELTKNRLDILSKTQKQSTDFKVHDLYENDQPVGTQVELLIPIITKRNATTT